MDGLRIPTTEQAPVFSVPNTGARLLELVERNAARGRGTYVEPGWVVGWLAGMMGSESGFGETLLEAVDDALAEAA